MPPTSNAVSVASCRWASLVQLGGFSPQLPTSLLIGHPMKVNLGEVAPMLLMDPRVILAPAPREVPSGCCRTEKGHLCDWRVAPPWPRCCPPLRHDCRGGVGLKPSKDLRGFVTIKANTRKSARVLLRPSCGCAPALCDISRVLKALRGHANCTGQHSRRRMRAAR